MPYACFFLEYKDILNIQLWKTFNISGKQLQTIDFPARRITSCCFGGPNYDELFVTCGRSAATEEELKEYPLSGSLFRVTGLGIKGTKSRSFPG